MSLHELQSRVSEAVSGEVKTDAERLYDAHQEGKRLQRQGEELCKSVRAEIDAMMEQGELVGYPDAHLSLQSKTTYDVDQEKAMQVLSAAVWKRAAEVTPKKLKALLEAGVLTKKEFDKIATPVVSTSLVTTTNPR